MDVKAIIGSALLSSASVSAVAAEYHGYVRGVHLHDTGKMSVYMESNSHTLEQCKGPFGVDAFSISSDSSNTHVVSTWISMLDKARVAKLEQQNSGAQPDAVTDPALIKLGYTVTAEGSCTLKYVYNLHWYN